MSKYQSGDVVEFKNNLYWVYEIKGTDAVIIPMDNLDFEQELMHLDGAIHISQSRLKPYSKD